MRSQNSSPRSANPDEIWDMKYRFKRADGAIVDTTIEDTLRRAATALADKHSERWKATVS